MPASTDVIHKVLGTLSPGQLLEIVIHLKVLARANPIQARQLLQQNPQLSYAVLECLLTLNLVDTTVVQVPIVTMTQADNVRVCWGLFLLLLLKWRLLRLLLLLLPSLQLLCR